VGFPSTGQRKLNITFGFLIADIGYLIVVSLPAICR